MPVPSAISDLSTVASSNPPGGGETPAEGDNHIRAAYSFIAALRDILNGTSSTTAAVQTLIVSGAATFNGNVTLGSDGSDALTINAATNIAGTLTAQSTATFEDVVTFDANPAGRITSGTYTPAPTNGANVDSSTAYSCTYIRVGNVVLVSGGLDVDPTASGTTDTVVDLSIPIASNFTDASDLSGNGVAIPALDESCVFTANVADNRAVLTFRPNSSSSSHPFKFTFVYRVL